MTGIGLFLIILMTANIVILLFIYRLACQYKYRDPMTQIYNKQYLELIVKKWISRKKDFTICFFDIDKFKLLNDTYGHLAGDKGIIHLANSLNNSFKRKGIAARIGGDEFAVVFLGHINDIDDAIFDELKEHCYEHNGKSISFKVSIGVCCSDAALSYEGLMEQSDKMLYAHKKRNSLNILHTATTL